MTNTNHLRKGSPKLGVNATGGIQPKLGVTATWDMQRLVL